MKLLLVLPLILVGCVIPPKKAEVKPVKLTREATIINCTNQFIDKALTGKSSYDICRDIYKRGE